MTEATLVTGAFLVGAVVTLPLRDTATVLTRLALALPVGIGCYLLVAWLLVAPGVAFSPLVTVGIVAALGIGAAELWVLRHGVPDPLEVIGFAAAAIGVFVLSLVLQAVPMTRLTSDSLRYLVAAGMLGTGGLEQLADYDIVHRHLAEALLYAPAALTPLDHLPSVMPLVGLAGFGATVTLADEVARRSGAVPAVRVLLGAAALVALLSTNRGVYNLFYVHGHMLVAVALVVAVAATWLAVENRRWAWTLLAAGALTVLVATRAEGLLLAVLVLVPAVAVDRLAPRQLWVLVGAPVAAAALWFGLVVRPRVVADGASHADGALLVAGLLVFFTALRGVGALRWAYRHAGGLLVAGLATALLVSAIVEPAILVASGEALWANITGVGGWRLTWLGLPVLVAAALWLGHLEHAAVWRTPLLGFVPLLLLLPYLRGTPYRVGPGDSGNRILMHILLVAVAFVVAVAARSSSTQRTVSR